MASSKKSKTATLTRSHALPPSSGHWTQYIEPHGAALLSEMLQRCHFIVKNHGPATVKLVAQHGDLMDLPSGAVRATYAFGLIRVENPSKERVFIEFDFLPVTRSSN
jgi:hypothetical protein